MTLAQGIQTDLYLDSGWCCWVPGSDRFRDNGGCNQVKRGQAPRVNSYYDSG